MKGQPDFGALAPTETIVGLSDLGELAARLGSIVTFDRRGNVIFLEDFEGSLAKCICDYSSGGSVAISSKYCRGGCFACKMTTGPEVNNWARIQIPLAYPALSKMGFEVCWNRSDRLALRRIEFLFGLYDGTKQWWPNVRWESATNTWEYRSAAFPWVALSPTADYYDNDLPFINIKLVVDFVNKEYVRLIANDTVYDLAGLGFYSGTDVGPARINPTIITYTKGPASAVNYIDNIIVTQNEP